MLRIILFCTFLALSACASIPSDLKSGEPFSVTTPLQAQLGDSDGEWVRWGGIIVETKPQNDQTCFEVMGLLLDRNAEPRSEDYSIGRFIACARGFYDPVVYTAGRAITFTGRIDGIRQQKIGDYGYSFPRLNADAVHLWPEHPDIIYVPTYDPFWDPYWPYYYRPYPYYPHRR